MNETERKIGQTRKEEHATLKTCRYIRVIKKRAKQVTRIILNKLTFE